MRASASKGKLSEGLDGKERLELECGGSGSPPMILRHLRAGCRNLKIETKPKV